MKKLAAKSYADFSKGVYQAVAEALAPENSVKLNLNLNSDEILGWLISRLGTTRIGNQLAAGKPNLGIFNFRDSVGGQPGMLFAVFSNGSNNIIYNAIDGSSSLTGDTKDLKTRFLTYLDSCLRLNGTDGPKAWNGAAWVTTGGAFDLANMPAGVRFALEFKDRVYVAGGINNPDRVDVSGIANSVTRQISWTVDNKFFLAEQEDGGGGITGLAKVPGYVLMFKKRTLKRYDGVSTYPEDMVNQGAPSQEAIVVAKGTAWWMNENGAWASQGADPKKISSYTVDNVIKSCTATDLANVAAGSDEDHVWWSFKSVTMNGETYTNIVLKYNILQNTWDVRKYPTLHGTYCKYVDSTGAVFIVTGDSDGNVLKMDTGFDDNGIAIPWALETQDLVFGFRAFIKAISRFGIITEDISKANVMWRSTHNPEDWEPLGLIEKEVMMFDKLNLKGTHFNFKVFDSNDSGRSIIKAIEFPEGILCLDSTE